MTKIDLITGILGSGKTTFIIKYVKYLLSCGKRVAILENDFGAVNVDALLLNELKCDNCLIEMVTGGGDPDCHKRRFKTQLIALGMQHFDRVIIEPSGIFDMDEFFDTLYEPPLDNWFEIGNVLSIVDAELDDKLSDQMEYLLGSEISCCGKLVLSKTGAVKDVSKTAERVIAHINRAMEYIKCRRRFSVNDMLCKDWEKLDESDFSALVSAGYDNESYVKLFSGDDIRSMTHYFMNIRMKEAVIEKTVRDIMNDSKCGHIYRIKGFTKDDNENWLKINAVGDKTEIAPIQKGQSVFIVIGDDIVRENIDRHFKEVNSDPEYVSI